MFVPDLFRAIFVVRPRGNGDAPQIADPFQAFDLLLQNFTATERRPSPSGATKNGDYVPSGMDPVRQKASNILHHEINFEWV